MAPIKDAIITHTSGLFRQQIQTQKQKKELQTHLTEKVANRLKTLTGKKVISDLYLTRIIIQ
ncbi:MAG: flagellar basal body-associated FliL family protein [gamma proteobacterium symbiont of Lucinoma myriamae]|nr:flagellar basal body-associated FliL family protein [gamma proteobacterium symbiont of Lucinoma myriamae]MCU7832695.1 flagellar basal body-associated FliL family protein [gamma proteobacterium symbiont of Lucinoma myriamae]